VACVASIVLCQPRSMWFKLGKRPSVKCFNLFNQLIVAIGSILLFSIAAYPQSDSQPTGFEFYYNGPARGMRLWSRSGATWTETYSSGQKGTFRVRKAFLFKGVTGTLVQKVDEGDFFVFIPDV